MSNFPVELYLEMQRVDRELSNYEHEAQLIILYMNLLTSPTSLESRKIIVLKSESIFSDFFLGYSNHVKSIKTEIFFQREADKISRN